MAQSSTTSTSMRLSRASRLRKLPSARAIARSRNSAGRSRVIGRVSVAASLLREGAGDKTLADAGWSEHENVLVMPTHGEFRQPRTTFFSNPRAAR